MAVPPERHDGIPTRGLEPPLGRGEIAEDVGGSNHHFDSPLFPPIAVSCRFMSACASRE